MENEKEVTATFSGEYETDGYGEHPIFDTKDPLPRFRNAGYNVFVPTNCSEKIHLENIETVKTQDMIHKYILNSLGGFYGWIYLANNNSKTKIFISNISEDYNSEKKVYNNNIFNFIG